MTTSQGPYAKGTIAVPRSFHQRLLLEKARRTTEAVRNNQPQSVPTMVDLVEEAIKLYLKDMAARRANGTPIPVPALPDPTRTEETTTVTVDVSLRNSLNMEVSQQRIDLADKISWTIAQRDVLAAALRHYIDQLPAPD